MRLPALIVRECVEYPERGRSELDAEPGGGGMLRLDERESRRQEGRNFCLLARLCLETEEEPYLDHVISFRDDAETAVAYTVEADTRRMNAFIEDAVRTMPEQYYWVHRRFKTRPEGEARCY